MRPLLRVAPFSGRVMLITAYREARGMIDARTKYDVTEQFQEAACEYLARLAEAKLRREGKWEEDKDWGGQYLRDGLDELVVICNARRDGSGEPVSVPAGERA